MREDFVYGMLRISSKIGWVHLGATSKKVIVLGGAHHKVAQERSPCAAQPTTAAPSSAVARSLPPPVQSCTVKRANHSSAAVERAVAAHADVEIAQQASIA